MSSSSCDHEWRDDNDRVCTSTDGRKTNILEYANTVQVDASTSVDDMRTVLVEDLPRQHKDRLLNTPGTLIGPRTAISMQSNAPDMSLSNHHEENQFAESARSALHLQDPQQLSARPRAILYHEQGEVDVELTLKFDAVTAAAFRAKVSMSPGVDANTDTTIMIVESDREAWIIAMVKAVYNLVDINDKPTANQCNLFRRGTTTCVHVGVVESACHAVFDALLDRCKNGFRGPQSENHAINPGAGRMHDQTADCATRLQNVVEALRSHKTICRDILYNDFKRQLLVNHPLKYSDKKKGHLGCNDQKAKNKKHLEDRIAQLSKENADSAEIPAVVLRPDAKSNLSNLRKVKHGDSKSLQLSEPQQHLQFAETGMRPGSHAEPATLEGTLRDMDTTGCQAHRPSSDTRNSFPVPLSATPIPPSGNYHHEHSPVSVNGLLPPFRWYSARAHAQNALYQAQKRAPTRSQDQNCQRNVPPNLFLVSEQSASVPEALPIAQMYSLEPRRGFEVYPTLREAPQGSLPVSANNLQMSRKRSASNDTSTAETTEVTASDDNAKPVLKRQKQFQKNSQMGNSEHNPDETV